MIPKKNHNKPGRFLILTAVLLLSAGIWFGLNYTGKDRVKSELKNLHDPVLAEIGDYVVSEEEFLGAFRNVFERSGRSLQVTRSLLRDILDQRVHFYSSVQYAVDQGWDSDHEGLYQKNMIYRQVMMDEFKRSIIEPRVSVDEKDIEYLFLRYNTHVRASHLYAPDRKTADSLYSLIADGVSFEKLAEDTFESASLRESGGDLGYFTVDDMDVGFEQVAFKMPVGEVSRPVRTSRGFSIIKVTDRITTPIITEYQYARKKNRIRELAVRQKTELERRSDMDRVTEAFDFDAVLIAELWKKLNGYVHLDPLSGPEQGDFRSRIPSSWDKKVICTYDDFEFTVGLFLQEVYYTPGEARNNVQTASAFQNLVEGTAYRSWAISFYKNSNAYDHDLVERSVENTFQNYLSRRLTRTLKDEADYSDEELRRMYDENPDHYVHPKEVNMAELAVRSPETAEEAYRAIQEGMPFREALVKFGFDEEAKLAGGEIGFTPVTHFGTIAPSISNIRTGDVIGPFEMSNDVVFLFKCLGVRDPRPMNFEEAAPVISNQLTDEYVTNRRMEIIGETMEHHGSTIHYNRIDLSKLQL